MTVRPSGRKIAWKTEIQPGPGGEHARSKGVEKGGLSSYRVYPKVTYVLD
jgi:hypothetical protein